jgi:hypothetical protein
MVFDCRKVPRVMGVNFLSDVISNAQVHCCGCMGVMRNTMYLTETAPPIIGIGDVEFTARSPDALVIQ